MKYLYIVDYWVPFPSSEYGGLVNLIAESDNEAFQILSEEEQFDSRYADKIMERVIHSQKFELSQEYQSGLIEAFVT
jgi:hypothetical protein